MTYRDRMGTAQPPNSQIPKELIAGTGFLHLSLQPSKFSWMKKEWNWGEGDGQEWNGLEVDGMG